MADIQDKLNQILNNPDALKQVQSLGEQLGLTSAPKPQPPAPEPVRTPSSEGMANEDMLKLMTRVAPLMSSFKKEDNTTRLLHALRPFLSIDRQQKLDKAEKMIKIINLMPLLKDSNLLF